MTYDPDVAPDPQAWLALDDAERIDAIGTAHAGPDDTLHQGTPPAHIHHRLHAMVEDHTASGEPAITGATVARLTDGGMRRHAAVHMICEVLLRALAAGRIGDPEAWGGQLEALDPSDWIGRRLREHLGPESES